MVFLEIFIMEVNYSDKELENFNQKRSVQGAGQNPSNTQRINNLQNSSFQSRPQTPPKTIPPQEPKKEIAPPPNIPTISSSGQPRPSTIPSSQTPQPITSQQGLKFDFSKLLSNKSFIIGASAVVIVVAFALITLGFSSGGKGGYKNLEPLLLSANQPSSFHSKTEIFIKSKEVKKGSFIGDYLSNLIAQVAPPAPPIPYSMPPVRQEPPNYSINKTTPPKEIDRSLNYWAEDKMQNTLQMPIPEFQEDLSPSSLNADFPQDFEIKLTIDANQKITSDKKGIDKLKAAINFMAKAELMNFSGSAQILFKNDILYFKLDPGSLIDILMPDVSGKWIKVDFKTVFKQFAGIDYEKIIAQNLQSNSELEKQIAALFSKTKIQDILAIHKSKAEKISSVDAYYYELSFKKEFLSGMIMDLFRILSEEIAKQTTGLNIGVNPSAFINEFKNEQEEIKKAADIISQIPFELWIGKKDNLVYKFKIDIGKVIAKIESQFPPAISPIPGQTKNKSQAPAIEGYFLVEYSDYGKDFNVEEPAEYENIETILGSFGIGGGPASKGYILADKKARNSKRIEDVSNLRLALELYYVDYNKYPIALKLTRLDEKNNPFEKTLVSKEYIGSVPTDPLSPDFYYAYKSDGKKYELSARLEYYPDIQDKCDPSTNQMCLYIVKGGY